MDQRPIPIQRVSLTSPELDWSLDRIEHEQELVLDRLRSLLEETEAPETIEYTIRALRGEAEDGGMVVAAGRQDAADLLARFYALDARRNQLERR